MALEHPRRGQASLLERLDADDVAELIAVPERRQFGGIVDPGVEVEAPGRRQYVFNPPMRLRIESSHAATLHFAGPDLAVLIGLGRIQVRVRGRQPVLGNRVGLRVVLDQAIAAYPDRTVRGEGAAPLAADGELPLPDFTRLGIEPHDILAAAPEVPAIPAHEV